jgi:hypothetical protein
MHAERKRFNEVLLPGIYNDVWETLITCNGRYTLNQTEVSLQWNIDGNDVMQRYVKYQSKEAFLQACAETKPHTIALGGVLPGFPGLDDRSAREHDNQLCKAGITSAQGPVVLDVDLTDYNRDTVCDCGALKRCCNTCFAVFLDPAMDVIHYILRTIFGFTKFFFVWSGRRGIHVWIYDDRVLTWTRDQRTVFINRIKRIPPGDAFGNHIKTILSSAMDAPERAALRARGGDLYDELYPKFDVEVTKDARHLKKLPMAIHAATCVLCMPTPPVGSGFRFRPDDHTRKPNDMSVEAVEIFSNGIKKALTTRGV